MVRQLAIIHAYCTSQAIRFSIVVGVGMPRDVNMVTSHASFFCIVCRDDDEMRTGLRGHITALMPQEIILPRKGLTATTSKVLRASLRNPRQHQLTPGDRFWDAERTLQEIKEAAYFNPTIAEQPCLPQALQVSVLHCGDNLDALHTAMYFAQLRLGHLLLRTHKVDVGARPAELG